MGCTFQFYSPKVSSLPKRADYLAILKADRYIKPLLFLPFTSSRRKPSVQPPTDPPPGGSFNPPRAPGRDQTGGLSRWELFGDHHSGRLACY